MNLAQGLPQLDAATAFDDGWLYPAVDEPDHLIHVPASLEVAPSDSGEPDLSLEVVRGQSPFLPPEPYGVLDFRVRPAPVDEAVLAAARLQRPGATVTPALLEGGHLRLQFVGGSSAVEPAVVAELEAPSAVASNGLDSGRVIRRLTVEAALLLRDVLAASGLTFTAVAEMSMRGLAERAPAAVSFDPRALASALVARADDRLCIAHAEIAAIWSEDGAVPLIRADGVSDLEHGRLARILADWTVAAYGAPTAAVSAPVAATVQLALDGVGDAPLTWDLSRGRTALRTVVLRLDPFDAASRLVGERGLDAVWRETVVPPLETGFVSIDVDTNLPAVIEGVVRCGVELRSAPNPPHRAHALSDALLFDEEAPRRIVWRLSPKEELRYEYTTFVLVRRAGSVRRVDGVPTPCDDRNLLIGVADLPIDLLSIRAGAGLVRDGIVRGTWRPEPAGGEPAPEGLAFELSAERPTVSVALLPDEADELSIHVEACPLGEGTCVSLGPLPPRSLHLDLTSFPQFGPQTVEVSVAFDVTVPLVALELLSERDALAQGRPTVLSFTPHQATRQWHYLSSTPFHSGYRYRPHDRAGAAWSSLRPAGSALLVPASQVVARPANGRAPMIDRSEFVFEDVLCYPSAEPNAFLVVPTTALPETDGAGRPVVMSVAVVGGGLLQLGVQLGPSDQTLERLRLEVARRHGIGDARLIRLGMAPLEIEGVVLLVDGGAGELAEVARHGTSGFPPFSAIFSETLNTDQARGVDAALAGQQGRAVVTYAARVERPAAGGLTWQPLRASTDLATWFAPVREDDR